MKSELNMPLPKPFISETKEDYIKRAMKELAAEYPDEKQRFAIINQLWEARKMSDNISPILTLEDGTAIRTHKLLSGRTIYTKNQGEIPITESLIDTIVKNFNDGVMEIAPFIDLDHSRAESYGQIIGVKKEIEEDGNPALFIDVEWNNRGQEMIKNKVYMYLSADIEPYINSKTGEKTDWVLHGAALTNYPADKAQNILKLSDTLTGSIIKLEDTIMTPEISKMIEDLLAVYTNSEDLVKEEIKKAIMDAIGGKKPEAEIEVEVPEMKGVKCEDVKLADKAQVIESEFLKLSEKHNAVVSELEGLKKTMKLSEFKSKYLGVKITPDQYESFSKLFLADEASATEILEKMPSLNLTSEIGAESTKGSYQLSDQDKQIMVSLKMNPEKQEDVEKFISHITK